MVHWLQKEEAMVVALLGTETTKTDNVLQAECISFYRQQQRANRVLSPRLPSSDNRVFEVQHNLLHPYTLFLLRENKLSATTKQ